jgi:hypothetical protein|tara:strand:- start:89 stop:355 length:267 start_codon:yes stop_codon:yes gene_type:complete
LVVGKFFLSQEARECRISNWSKSHDVKKMVRRTLACFILIGLTWHSLVKILVEVVGKSATTAIKVTRKTFGAALDALDSDDPPEIEEE